MSNKAILKATGSVATELVGYYQAQDLEKISAVLTDYLAELKAVEQIPKKYSPEQTELTHTIGNSKIGTDTLCISFGTGLLCCMGLTGHCDNCGICYAVAQNKQYFKNTVPKNTINQLLVTRVLLGDLELHQLLQNTVYSIFCSYSDRQLAELKFLRINVEGDILNNEYLAVINQIADCLKSVFELWSCYGYTHNTELDLFIADSIKFNCSDFYNASSSSCRTIDSVTDSIKSDIINRLVALCDGDCNCCSYCKDPDNTKTVLFLKHGGQYKGFKGLENQDPELAELVRQYKKEAYYYFELKQTAGSL